MTTNNSPNSTRVPARPKTASLVAHDFRVPVPDGPDGDPDSQRVEDDALLASPEFQARLARARENKRAGRGITSEALYAEIGYAPPHERKKGERGKRGTPNGRLLVRVPISVHEELVARAEHEGISVNQLVLAYLSRSLGVDAARSA